MSTDQPRLRHIVLAVEDIDVAAAELADVLGIEEAFREPPDLGLDMRNVVLPVGDQFLEVCQGSHADAPVTRYLRRFGPGGYMVLLQYQDFEDARNRAVGNGARLVWEHDEPTQRECHLHPKDTGGAMVGIEWSREWTAWRWAGTHWRRHVRTHSVSAITGITISADDPEAVAARWAELFGLDFAGASTATTHGDTIRVARWAQPGSRVTAVELTAADAIGIRDRAAARGLTVDDDRVRMLGIDFILRP